MNSRQQIILQMVIDQGQVSVIDLAKATGASEVTIRQDFNILEKLSYLRRVHGFVASLDSGDVEIRMMNNYTPKRELAEFVVSLAQPGEAIFTENGSSNALFTRTLGKQKKNVTIITVSSYIAHLLRDVPCEAILLGGAYQKKSENIVDPLVRQCTQQVYFSKAFTGVDGWQPETGFTGRDMMCTDVVNVVLEKECEAIVLINSSKFDVVHSYSIGSVERLNRAITNSKIRASDLMYLGHSKLAVHAVDI